MHSPTTGRPSNPVFVLLFGLVTAAVGLVLPTHRSLNETNLIASLSEARVGTGRLFRASATPFDSRRHNDAITRSAIEILSSPESLVSRRIQGLVYAGTGDLKRAAEVMSQLSDAVPDDPEVLNDLGVIYLALGEENALNYFKAASLFDRASRLAVGAPAPRFNAVQAYRRVGLYVLHDKRLAEYNQIESSTFWNTQLTQTPATDTQLLDRLAETLARGNTEEAISLTRVHAGRYRGSAIAYVLNPPETSALENVIDFIFAHSPQASDDPTTAAMLAPLQSRDRHSVVDSRRLVSRGIEAYQQGKVEESLHLYDLAEAAAWGAHSPFDNLWIKLNRADSELRLGNTKNARPLLETVITQSRNHGYKWLSGKALSARGADSTLTTNYEELLQILSEAISTLNEAGAPQDANRAIYYLASAHSLAGDFETSLNLSYRALSLSPEREHVRRAQLFWLAGLQLYRLGFEEYALGLEKESIKEAEAARNPGLISFISPYLALMHVSQHDAAEAQRYLAITKAALDQTESSRERDLNDLVLNLLCARIQVEAGNPSEAEACLNQNMAILKRMPIEIPDYFAQTLLQLSEVHALKGQFDMTRLELKRAADVLEGNDTYLAASGLRVSFENERRSLFDKAIDFEYNHDGKDAAWSYAQDYRSKLFLEFLRQMNPGVDRIHDAAIDRNKVQRLIPSNVQVIEYVMLQDRLLIWLLSNDKFQSVLVPVSRAAIERKVSNFLRRIQSKDDVRKEAADLHRLLIEPIEASLDTKLALAIIPDQALHRLSFPALYSESKKSYLVERYTILENPSLTSLLSATPGLPLRSNAVAFGAQTDDTNATLELKGLEKYYDNIRSFNGTTAVKQAFLASLTSANIFHYAGHSQDASDPLRSSILLDGRTEGPNSVTAVDISKRRMPPNSVVVLASCDSSVGNSRDGVGMRGLTSAFLISGAGSVVGSLWLVEADSTSRLVLAFHKGFVQDKLPVAEALRTAQLKSIAEGRHPYYWSGFVVTGNVSALR